MQSYKLRLRQVRDNDATHELEMRRIADAAGDDLDKVRRVMVHRGAFKSYDAAMIKMINAAAGAGVYYGSDEK